MEEFGDLEINLLHLNIYALNSIVFKTVLCHKFVGWIAGYRTSLQLPFKLFRIACIPCY